MQLMVLWLGMLQARLGFGKVAMTRHSFHRNGRNTAGVTSLTIGRLLQQHPRLTDGILHPFNSVRIAEETALAQCLGNPQCVASEFAFNLTSAGNGSWPGPGIPIRERIVLRAGVMGGLFVDGTVEENCLNRST